MDGPTPFLQEPPRLPDAWDGDPALRESLAFHLGDELFAVAEAELSALGRWATSSETLALAARADREPPVHVPYGPWGQRVDDIVVSDAFLELGRVGIEAGVTALPYEDSPYGERARVVWGGLVLLWGPSSALYSCPVAMTDAAARTLLTHGDEDDAAVVKHLVSRDPEVAWTSGQWMTETSGGSDVGGTETVAVRDGELWRLYGTKWFTSATTAEIALTLARPRGAPPGSRSLALFRVHRTLADGSRNAIVVRRLKDKLGTRALPTAELELRGAVARPVGNLDPAEGGGLRRIATMLNLTRLHNTLAAAAALGRGLAWARAHARVRQVFGRTLAHMPAQRAVLADLAADHAAALTLALRCCELTGRLEAGSASPEEEALLRGLTPIAKLATARWAVAGVSEAMEAVGGVGYCEDSGIPALVRDAHVLPIWEGTTNVLALDALRAEARVGALRAVIADAREAAQRCLHDEPVAAAARVVEEAAGTLGRRLEALGDGEAGETDARALALGAARTYACARLCLQGAWAARRTSATARPEPSPTSTDARLGPSATSAAGPRGANSSGAGPSHPGPTSTTARPNQNPTAAAARRLAARGLLEPWGDADGALAFGGS